MDINKFIDYLRLYRQDRKKLCEAAALIAATPNISRNLPLPKQVDQEIKKYCRNVLKGKGSPDWIRILVALTKEFKYGYLPEDFLINRLIPWLNPPGMTWWVVDKGNLEIIFKDDAVPVLLTFDAGALRTNKLDLVSIQNIDLLKNVVNNILEDYNEVCLKFLGSSQGRNVYFLNNLEDILQIIKSGQRFVIQKCVNQHKDLAIFNQSSVNTVRIISLQWNGSIRILSSYLRTGSRGRRVDNIHSGGIGIGVDLQSHSLFAEGWGNNYNKHNNHPDTGIIFNGNKVPSMDKAIEVVVRAHSRIPVSQFLGWDIAIDTNGKPLIVEVNSHPNSLRAQVINGPLFQSHTDEILHSWFNQ